MTWQTMTQTQAPGTVAWKIALMLFILPALLSWVFSELMRKKGWIRPGDMKLDF